jgi:hypothetical protein
VVSLSGYWWFVSFIEDFSRTSWVYLLKDKSDVFSVFQMFHKMVQNQFNTSIKIVRSDNGGEYMSGNLGMYFREQGIIHQTTCVDTPHQNCVAERKNRHLLEVTRSLMHTHVPKSYWGDALLTATYLINRMPSRVLDFKTPLEVLSPPLSASKGVSPKVFGCVCFVHVHGSTRGKLDPRSLKCVFVGYSPTQKGYKCYHPPSRKQFVSMDVTFFETQSYFSSSHTPLQGESQSEEEFLPLPVPTTMPEQEKQQFTSGSTTEPTDKSCGSPVEELRVYSRCQKSKTILVAPCQASYPDSGNTTSTSNSVIPTFDSVTPVVNDMNLPIAQRKGVRSCTHHPVSDFVSYQHLSSPYRSFVSKLSSVSVPRNLQEALSDPPKWRTAMQEEMKALHKNETWDLVKLPNEKKAVGCKWVFTIKHKADGSEERYKARLVAKGFTQTYGIDYEETFAPVAKMNSIRVLLSIAANLGWPLQQFDVKNAFLHGDLEEVYMEIPPGLEDSSSVGKVCKLKKALYGLKQSPRAWFERFSRAMQRFGYKQSQADHTLFIKHTTQEKVTALIVYVDDIVLTGNDDREIQNLRHDLANEFEIKDLGSLKYFLGIEVARSKHGIFISQRKYILDLLKETGMLGCKATDNPVEVNVKLGEDSESPLVDKGRYQQLVGRLIYLSHTRPNIAYAASVVSQFMHSPRESHMEAVYRILRYLKSSPGKGLLFSRHGHLKIEAYTDADWAGSIMDRRSMSGYCTFVGGNLVTWRSKKQSVVARSSAEAEFRAMAHGV